MRQAQRVITWGTLLSGAIGSSIAVIATFSIAIVTFRRTRRADELREQVRDEERQDERRERVVAEVIGTFHGLESEVRWAPFLAGRASARMLEATMLFYLTERRRHPDIANWVLHQKDEYDRLVRRWRRVWWVPGLRGKRLLELGQFLGKMIAVLVTWAAGDMDDQLFANTRIGVDELVAGATAAKESV